jgi:hypothetical protein
MKINAVVIFFILLQLETLQHDTFPNKFAFAMTFSKAERQTFKGAGICLPSPVIPHAQLHVACNPSSSFAASLAIIQRARQCVENG